MKILVVAAMPNELKAIREGIKSAGLKANLNVDYLCCGIGNYEAISSLEHYLTENKEPAFIWNIGICGYWNQGNKKETEPIQLSSVINIHTKKEMVIPPFLQIAHLKTCFSGEYVILEKPDIQRQDGVIDDVKYFDMESRGIEFVASKYRYPRLILKIPFYFISDSSCIRDNYYSKISDELYAFLKSLRYHDFLTKFLYWFDCLGNGKNYL